MVTPRVIKEWPDTLVSRRRLALAVTAVIAALRTTASGKGANQQMSVQECRFRFEHPLREDLERRLTEVRWSDAVTTDWRYGMNRGFLQALVGHWRTSYDFNAAEQRLNALPQYRATIDGFGVYYRILKGRGPGARPLLFQGRGRYC